MESEDNRPNSEDNGKVSNEPRRRCPACHKECRTAEGFCQNCGAPIDPRAAWPPPPTDINEPGTSQKDGSVLLGVVCGLLMFGLGFSAVVDSWSSDLHFFHPPYSVLFAVLSVAVMQFYAYCRTRPFRSRTAQGMGVTLIICWIVVMGPLTACLGIMYLLTGGK